MLEGGVQIEPSADTVWAELHGGLWTLGEYASTNGICMRIGDKGGNVWVNAPIAEGASVQLVHTAGSFAVRSGDAEFDATIIPVPAYHEQTYIDRATGQEHRYTNLGVTHTDRVRISPIEGCGMTCKFCNIPYELKYRKKDPEELLRVIELAKDDPLAPARHVLISGGTPKRGDEPWEDELYETIMANSPLPVDIMMTPREDPGYPQRLKDAGINSLSVNMEVFNSDRAKRLTPNKNRRFGPEGYLDYIARAIGVLGVGRVQSLILVGRAIEPLESTLAGVRALVDRGCIPVLSPFRPDARTPMEEDPIATRDELRHVYEETLRICDASGTGIKPGPRCIPCHHNTAAFGDGSEFYIDEGEADDITRPFQ